MQEIDIKSMQINQPIDCDEEETIPYKDIEMLAEKINEIINFLLPNK